MATRKTASRRTARKAAPKANTDRKAAPKANTDRKAITNAARERVAKVLASLRKMVVGTDGVKIPERSGSGRGQVSFRSFNRAPALPNGPQVQAMILSLDPETRDKGNVTYTGPDDASMPQAVTFGGRIFFPGAELPEEMLLVAASDRPLFGTLAAFNVDPLTAESLSKTTDTFLAQLRKQREAAHKAGLDTTVLDTMIAAAAEARTDDETGDDEPGETGDDEPGETGDDEPGETGDDEPGETGDDEPGETGDDEPGETGDDEPGDDEPGETGDDEPGETGDDDFDFD